MIRTILLSVLLVFAASSSTMAKTYLFILSGQSNMARLDPNTTFTPAVQEALAPDEVIVVKRAVGGKPIMRWYKGWKPGTGDYPEKPESIGTIYDSLMTKVEEATKGKHVDCITFVWMQGERDANTGNADVYEASFKGLVKQLEDDLGVTDINVVYGRLSDYEANKKAYADWQTMREVQVSMAEANPHWEWVDTDDLNGETNDIHYIGEGSYDIFGQRLAEKALKLIKEHCD